METRPPDDSRTRTNRTLRLVGKPRTGSSQDPEARVASRIDRLREDYQNGTLRIDARTVARHMLLRWLS